MDRRARGRTDEADAHVLDGPFDGGGKLGGRQQPHRGVLRLRRTNRGCRDARGLPALALATLEPPRKARTVDRELPADREVDVLARPGDRREAVAVQPADIPWRRPGA